MTRRVIGYGYWGSINGSLAEKFVGRVKEQNLEYGYQVQAKVTTIDELKRKQQQIIGRETDQFANINSLLLIEQGELGAKLLDHGYSKKAISLLKKCLAHYKYYETCLVAFESNVEVEANKHSYYNYCRGKAAAYQSVILSLLHKDNQ
ncbi:MAG: hypothetical protein KGZ96_13245 [Clostridia bacterium]|nr:hypothetical protein [Clostridia bacterium]